MSEFSTVVICGAEEPIRLGDELLGGVISGAAVGNLMAELEQYKLDAERLNFMISEQCIMQSQNGASGNSVYSLYWPHLGESQREWVKSPREAIDAALNQQQAEVKL